MAALSDGSLDLAALAQRVAAARGTTLDDATNALETWLDDPAHTWASEADILAGLGIGDYNPASNGTTGVVAMADTDPTVAQVLAQNGHIAQALYDVVRELGETDPTKSAALIQDAKAHVNALDPSRFTFS